MRPLGQRWRREGMPMAVWMGWEGQELSQWVIQRQLPGARDALPPARASSRRCPWRVCRAGRSGIESKMQRTVWSS